MGDVAAGYESRFGHIVNVFRENSCVSTASRRYRLRAYPLANGVQPYNSPVISDPVTLPCNVGSLD